MKSKNILKAELLKRALKLGADELYDAIFDYNGSYKLVQIMDALLTMEKNNKLEAEFDEEAEFHGNGYGYDY